MNRDDIEKLLGGYAAGTLTDDERQALFTAALEDQQLFESLAAEEPLRELLQDPAAKAQLLAALDDRPAPWYRRLMRPAFGIAAAAAMLLLAVYVRHEPPKPEPVVVAETRREPVRSFQPPIPVEKSPLPTVLRSKALPSPPQLPAPAPAALPLDAVAPISPPAAAPAAAPPPPPSGDQKTEQQSVAAAESDSLKVSEPLRAPAFRALNAFGDKAVASASPLGLRYTVFKKSPSGELTQVDPENELERSDQVVIRFEANEAGLLTVAQRDEPNSLRVIASDRLAPAVPYTFPKTGTVQASSTGPKEFIVSFSPQSLSLQKLAAQQTRSKVAGASAAGSVALDSKAQQGTFSITLKYK